MNESQDHWDRIVDAATDAVVRSSKDRGPAIESHLHYGAMGIDPKHLAIWYIYRTDEDLAAARSGGDEASLIALTRAELARLGFPQAALQEIHVGCESRETIEREAGGNPYQFFK